jgi:hypothetical protein
VKAIELVRKVVELRGALRERERGAVAIAARAVALRVVHATTIAARGMQSLPVPPPRPAERVVLSAAASQLRAMAELSMDAPTGDAEVDRALAMLVSETLALVDKVLASAPELAPSVSRRLGPRPEPAVAPAPDDVDAAPTKVRF